MFILDTDASYAGIKTKHKALKGLMNWRNPTTSQYHNWIGIMATFDFSIENRSGKDQGNADLLYSYSL